MIKMKVTGIVVMLLIAGFLGLAFQTENVRGATYTVGIGGNYANINSAIAAANPLGGDTIYVWEGIYNENVIVNKPLSLIEIGRAHV